ncbi:hypothetical protein XA68_13655 [Ophiocordyceps unilateralis]|uniref:Uncharacterized protein n=1 Tax=Ophiocordyceps unilateralis TaxID=268505 RepID=A0A2A9PM34_OPHUN|nr:hypothetical protein XA68_13655 [Ophiocordyceps unilateralis]
MPSSRPSWFARHCKPPPPLGASSACPCATCFNLPEPVPEPRRMAAGSVERRWASSQRRSVDGRDTDDDDNTYTTAHIEWVSK